MENNELQAKLLRLEQKNERYKSALEEIRIIATKDVSIESIARIQNKIEEVLE